MTKEVTTVEDVEALSAAEWEALEEEDWFEEYERQVEAGLRDSIHIKWIADGSETLAQVSENLRGYADYIDGLAAKGLVLESPVDNSHGELIHPSIIGLVTEPQ